VTLEFTGDIVVGIWLLLVFLESHGRFLHTVYLDGLEVVVRLVVGVNTGNGEVLLLHSFFELDLEMSFDVPRWDLDVELLHEHLEDDLASSKDSEVSLSVHWSGLEVDDDKIASSLFAGAGHGSSWLNSEAGSHSKHKISFVTMSETHVENVFSEVFIEVDDGVLEVTSAHWVVALSTSLVLVNLLGISSSEVSHVLLSTLHALFFIGVTMYLRNLVRWNSRFPVKAVGILRDDVLKVALIHKLNH